MTDARVVAALTPDFHSRAAYTGRLRQQEDVTIILDDGTVVEKTVDIYISWDTIQDMLVMVAERAGIPVKTPRKLHEIPSNKIR